MKDRAFRVKGQRVSGAMSGGVVGVPRYPWCRRCKRVLGTIGEIMWRKCNVCGHRTRTFVDIIPLRR